MALLRRSARCGSLLPDVARFYQVQLDRHPEATAYLQQAGLVNAAGLDSFSHRSVFPLEANLYGRTIGNAAVHRFLPGGKGGLCGWERMKHYSEVILVEGLF